MTEDAYTQQESGCTATRREECGDTDGLSIRKNRERVARVGLIMHQVLGTDFDVARHLAERWWNWVLRTRKNWQSAAAMDLDAAIARADGFPASQLRMLRKLDIPRSRGLVLATIHMGDYLGALFAIARELSGRPMMIVRRRPLAERDLAVFAKLTHLGVDTEVVVTTERCAALRLARGVSRGACAIMFYDLHAGFGSTSSVRFLGQHVRWVEGPARVAARSNALLLPFVTFEDPSTRKDVLHFAPAVDFERQNVPAAERSAVLRWMASFAEIHVRRVPDQWLHWSQFPAMAAPDARPERREADPQHLSPRHIRHR